MNVTFAENAFPEFNFRQLFLKDPNGVTLELIQLAPPPRTPGEGS